MRPDPPREVEPLVGSAAFGVENRAADPEIGKRDHWRAGARRTPSGPFLPRAGSAASARAADEREDLDPILREEPTEARDESLSVGGEGVHAFADVN